MHHRTLSATPPQTSADRATTHPIVRWLPLGAIAGPALFTLAWLILGFLSPGYTVGGDWISPYSPVAQPISGLGMGDTGPYMNAAFILSGILLLAGVIGVFRTLPLAGRPLARWGCAAGLALSPLGLIVAGIFTLDHLGPHFLGFGLVAATPVISLPATGILLRSIPGWRRFGTYLMVAGPLTLLMLVSYLVSFDQATTAANHGVAGITSRILGLVVHGWFAALGWLAYRRA